MKRNQALVSVSEQPRRKSQRLAAKKSQRLEVNAIDKKQPLTQLSLPDKLLMKIVSMLASSEPAETQRRLHRLSAVSRRVRHCVTTFIEQTNIHRSAVFDRNEHRGPTNLYGVYLYGVHVGSGTPGSGLNADLVRQLLKFNGATKLRLTGASLCDGWPYDEFLKLLVLLPVSQPIHLLDVYFHESWNSMPAFAASLTVLQLFAELYMTYAPPLLHSIGHCAQLQMLQLGGDQSIHDNDLLILASAINQLTKLTTLDLRDCFEERTQCELFNQLQRVPENLCLGHDFEARNFGAVKPGGYPGVKRICCITDIDASLELFLSTDGQQVLTDSFPNCALFASEHNKSPLITRDRLDSVLGGWLLRDCAKRHPPRKVKILLPTATMAADLPKRITYTTGGQASVNVEFNDFPSCAFDLMNDSPS